MSKNKDQKVKDLEKEIIDTKEDINTEEKAESTEETKETKEEISLEEKLEKEIEDLKNQNLRIGVSLIFNKLDNTLKNKGLKAMESSIGQEFNVDRMEAITRIPAPDKSLKGKVVDEIEAGYELGGKILRYAKVVVGE